jgi:hypothetical protein
VQGQIKEWWRELCERAVNEQDPKKFLVVVREINVLLEVTTERFKQSCPACAGRTSASTVLSVRQASIARNQQD